MFKVKVNDQFDFEIENSELGFSIDGEILEIDLSETTKNYSHVLYKNQSFNTEVIEFNSLEKTCTIKVNGNLYKITVEDQFDQLLKKLGLDNLSANKIREIKAPMPGLVLKIAVQEGMEVKKGDNLVILEAMKMENILKSSTDGLVSKVLITQGETVEKNQVLIQFK